MRTTPWGVVPLEAQRLAREERSAVREAFPRDARSPRILCWNCKKLTPFYEDRCDFCGTRFAGGTGGVYASSKPLSSQGPSDQDELAKARRTLLQLFEDLQRVHDLAPRQIPRARDEESATLFQCPSCGRFVAEDAASCLCGVRFVPPDVDCPECGSHVPGNAETCPVCQKPLREGLEVIYECPQCGTRVAPEATRCSCGAYFES